MLFDSEVELNVVFMCFKDLVDCKVEIFDEDIIVIVFEELVFV